MEFNEVMCIFVIGFFVLKGLFWLGVISHCFFGMGYDDY